MPDAAGLSPAELAAEGAVALPGKEVLSLLSLDVDADIALDVAAPVDLAAAANLNIAAPIDASVGANVLSVGSEATAVSQQQTLIDQTNAGSATAYAPQDATLTQSATPDTADTAPAPTESGTAEVGVAPTESGVPDISGLASGSLLEVNADIAADANVAAPIAGAIAANANVAAPIDASVAANVLSVDSSATSVSNQTAIITQSLDGASADATAEQTATLSQ